MRLPDTNTINNLYSCTLIIDTNNGLGAHRLWKFRDDIIKNVLEQLNESLSSVDFEHQDFDFTRLKQGCIKCEIGFRCLKNSTITVAMLITALNTINIPQDSYTINQIDNKQTRIINTTKVRLHTYKNLGFRHHVQKGDTLYNIARDAHENTFNNDKGKPSINQIMVAIFHYNRAAFPDRNINQLKSDPILTLAVGSKYLSRKKCDAIVKMMNNNNSAFWEIMYARKGGYLFDTHG